MKKVLVIDDMHALREEIMATLEFEGYDCQGAADGFAGLQLARTSAPDLILCDVMMPGLDGFATLERLRADPLTVGIPLVFLTAMADRESIERGLAMGAQDYLVKPLGAGRLLEAVRAWVL
jgi:CheY-like chemotaxis protein